MLSISVLVKSRNHGHNGLETSSSSRMYVQEAKCRYVFLEFTTPSIFHADYDTNCVAK